MAAKKVKGKQAGARAVTSVDVAAEAGVSQATVARTFSSPQLVSEVTQRRVREAAERIGYVPNAIARSLKSQRTNIIGAVVPALGDYWQNVLTEFSRQLAARDRQLLLFSFSDPDEVEGVLRSVQQYRLDGLILASATIGHPQLAAMMPETVPMVAFNQPAAAGLVDSVSVDNAGGMATVADHLADLGCRSVLFVGGVAETSTDQLRYQGAARRLGRRSIPCPYLETGAFTYEAGFKAGSTIVERGDLPDALMVVGDELAFGVLDGLADNGVDTPGDVLVTGFDGLPQSAWTSYNLTTLVQPTQDLVRRCLELLLDDNDPSRPADVVVPGTLRLGRTTGGDGPPTENRKRHV